MSSSDEAKRIIESAEGGYYRQALGVSDNASMLEISKAHLKLSSKYRDYPQALEAINNAYVKLRPVEKPYISRTHKFSIAEQKVMDYLAKICINRPLGFVAFFGTLIVIFNATLISVLAVVFSAVFLMLAAHFDHQGKTWKPFILLILFISQIFITLYFLLGKISPIWPVNVFLDIVLCIVILWRYTGNFLKGILDRTSRSSILRWLGIYCAVFMLTFGIANLVILNPPTLVFSQTIEAMQINFQSFLNWLPAFSAGAGGVLAVALKLGFYFFVFAFFASVFSGPNRQNWNSYSESRFCRTFTVTLLASYTLVELVYFLPIVGNYIGGVIGAPHVGSEPILNHLGGFFIVYLAYGAAIVLWYLFLTKIISVFYKNSLSLWTRFILASFVLIVAFYTVDSAIALLGLPSPNEFGFATFFNSLFGLR